MMENPLVGGVLQGWKQLLQRVKDHIHTLQCPGFEIFYVNFGIYIYVYCEFYSSSCHFASCRGYALTCVAVQGSGSIRGSHVEPKQSPVTLGAPLGWLGIRRSHITDLQHHQEVVSPKGSGGPSEPWRRIDSCYQFNTGSGATAHRYLVDPGGGQKQRK